MTKDQAAELLDLIVARAPELRAAGILTVSLGEAGFSLAPAELAPGTDSSSPREAEEEPATVLADPWTYGRPTPAAGPVVKAPARRPL